MLINSTRSYQKIKFSGHIFSTIPLCVISCPIFASNFEKKCVYSLQFNLTLCKKKIARFEMWFVRGERGPTLLPTCKSAFIKLMLPIYHFVHDQPKMSE